MRTDQKEQKLKGEGKWMVAAAAVLAMLAHVPVVVTLVPPRETMFLC